jgi:hypothetical protein
MNLEFTQGPEKEAVIEADDNIIPYILLEKEGNELVIRMKDNISVNSHKDIIVRLTAPDVTEFSLSGSGNINLKNTIEQDSPIRFKLAGMGDIEGRVNSPAVKISSAGSGNINLEGETKDLNISIAGSGNFKGTGLHTENTTVSIAGSGDAAVHASVTLVAKIAGSGDINYSGNPTVTSKIAGSGSVHKRDE